MYYVTYQSESIYIFSNQHLEYCQNL